MDLVNLLSEKLSVGLNKQRNENLVFALVRFYLSNGSMAAFLSYLQVLGVKDEQFGKDVYQIINDNIAVLEKLVNGAVVLDAATGDCKSKKPEKKKRSLKFNFEDDELGDFSSIPAKKSLDTVGDSELVPKRPIFKKIRKEKAMLIKKEAMTEEEEPLVLLPKKKASSSLSELANTERKNASLSGLVLSSISESGMQSSESIPEPLLEEDIENDREWYTAEEFGQVAQDYDEYDYEVAAAPAKIRPAPSVIHSGTGGTYSASGEYIDHDHVEGGNLADLSRIPITSHFFVPPFLEDVQEHLSIIEFGNSSSLRSIGPTVDPVKEPLSELAVTAREGSIVVKERKSAREKAKQAKDRSNLAGTAMGNVLGVQKHQDKPEEDDQDEDDDSEKDENKYEVTSMMSQRRFLPVFSVRNQLLQAISDNQVIIVVGETGSGKTTQLTQYLREEGYTKGGAMIGCTQPRRVAAMSVAKRVSEEVGCKLGGEVGYSIRFEDRTTKSTLIKYLTEGILLREIFTDPTLANYLCIIMDEAHERSLNTDILLGIFKNTVLPRRRDLKLIITSATMNADRFSTFFGDAPQFTIPGRTYPVDVLYSRLGSTDYVETAAKQVLSIHLLKWLESSKSNDGDILVFMTGQEDIEATVECIQEKLNLLDNPPPLDVLPIYSSMPADLQAKIFRKLNKRRRKCIVATNIAETSLTIDGIKYVIDSGLTKMKVYNAKLGMDTLQIVPVSLANAQQRSGRAGRTGPGSAFRLYTERATSQQQMYLQPIPEIQRTNLSNVTLMLKSFTASASKTMKITDFPFLDPPPQDLLSCSLYELWSIGALDNLGDMTSLGKQMNEFPMEPTLAKLILLLAQPQFHCLEEIISIVAMLSVPLCYYRPKERAAEADMVRDKFVVLESDHLTLLNIFRQWEAVPGHKRDSWCTKNFFHSRSLSRAKDVKQQLTLIMMKNRLALVRSRGGDEVIMRCLCAAFFQQLAKLLKSSVSGGNTSEYLNLRHTFMKMYLHPTSALNSGGIAAPLYVIYHELILTNKEYMSCVTAVQPQWLLEYGSVFYGVTKAIEKRLLNETGVEVLNKTEFQKRLIEDKAKLKERELRSNLRRKPITSTKAPAKTGSSHNRGL